MYSEIRTDLAIENRDFYRKSKKLNGEIPGIETSVNDSDNDIKITLVKINTKEAEKALGRPIGEYATIESKFMNDEIFKIDEKIIGKVSETLGRLVPLKSEKDSVLVVGLGNSKVTPDSLGPKVIENLDITRHLVKYHPELLNEKKIAISAIIPGVLGTTGIDTCEIIKGIVEKTKPNAVIAIDALAASEMHRISHTIQISNTGIIPGSGVKNDRNAINEYSLGIPVIAVGVPTVIGMPTMVNDNMMVTPNTIDDIVDNLSRIISEGINRAF